MPHTLTPELASQFARLALSHVEREYPNKLLHVMTGPDDVRAPHELHPMFYGSFDWHSCVHGFWLLATLMRRFPSLPESAEIVALFERRFTEENVDAELRYFENSSRAGFERPYGWAWLLMLSAELAWHTQPACAHWAAVLRPMARALVGRFTEFLPKATYPTRVGTHFNSAFAITLALEFADQTDDKRFGRLLRGRAVAWFKSDVDCQAWEPGGDDFLSSALMEAECMRRSLPREEFAVWFAKFLPRIAQGEPATLFVPATVSDRTDGKIAHLDGLNLSRAWCWRLLARTLPDGDLRQVPIEAAIHAHLDASLQHVSGDYMGEHWLATFAVLALTA